jgi:serine protease Do
VYTLAVNQIYYTIISLFITLLVGAGFFFGFSISPESEEIVALKERLSDLEERIGLVRDEASEARDELERRAELREKSQDDLLTAAVASIAPSVVSIVISKDVPKMEIVHVNPFGDDPFFKDFDIRVPRIVERGTERKQVGAGTGFFITRDGHIATNRHVVNDNEADYTVILSDGSTKGAQVIYKDSDIDFAIIKISGSSSKVSLGNSDSLKLGQSVFAIGNALGEFSNSVSVGIISGLNRQLEALSDSGLVPLNGVIQTDAAINPGNSGGPLSGLNGNVIGINVATVRGSENISFSIPVDEIKAIINREI